MILKKILGIILVLVGLIAAASGIFLSFAAMDAEPVLVSDPVEATQKVAEMMEAVVACDYEKASSLIYGNPSLGLEREPADAVGILLWNAFAKSRSYELKGGCTASNSGLAQQVVFTYLDMDSVTANLGDRAQALLMERIEAAENIDEIYDINNEYREDVVMEVLENAVAEALEENVQNVSVELTVNLVFRNGQWWIVADNALLNAISGGVLY